MFAYSTPGSYYERLDAGAPPVAPVRMDIAAFVGIARRGPLHVAVPVDSWRQFVAWFGDVTGAGYLAYAVRAFFDNGGRRCWIVRVASGTAVAASSVLVAAGGVTPVWRVSAAGAGVWGNDLDIQVTAAHRDQTVTLPHASTPEYASVASVAGFIRGAHVRITDPAGASIFRVVSSVDAATNRLYWINPVAAHRLLYEAPVIAADSNAASLIATIEYTLVVRERNRVRAVYDGLSLVPEHPRYGPHRLAAFRSGAATAGWSLSAAPEPIVITELRDAATLAALAPLDVTDPVTFELASDVRGADGLAGLTIGDLIGEPLAFVDADGQAAGPRGLRALEDISEPAAVAIPDILIQPQAPPPHAAPPQCIPDPCLPGPPPGPAVPRPPAVGDLPPVFTDEQIFRVQAELVLHCERRADRIALIDPPFSTVRDSRLGVAAIRAWRQRFESKYAALYFPWVHVVDPVRTGDALVRAVPPSGHVAGRFASSDRTAGVHKAPANEPMTWLQDTSMPIDNTLHGLLNDERINVIRTLQGRGHRILGARTLSSDTDWMYVNVRRLLIMIEKALGLACRWAVFEPNDHRTRAKLHLSITSYLLSLWQQGALAGADPAGAFFVRCSDDNNPAPMRERGQQLAEVGVAPAIPFEFIVVRVGRADNQFDITERGPAGGDL